MKATININSFLIARGLKLGTVARRGGFNRSTVLRWLLYPETVSAVKLDALVSFLAAAGLSREQILNLPLGEIIEIEIEEGE